MQIRRLNQDDVVQIIHIENSAPSSWSHDLIISELNQTNGIQLVAFTEDMNTIVGWCCARVIPPEAELLKITVSPQNRRLGAGTLLLQKLFEFCISAECTELFLEVRAANITALSFYKKIGFSELALRKNYYSHPLDDAIVLKNIFPQENSQS